MSWTICYETFQGTFIREGNSTMEYYRFINQLKFRNLPFITEPPSN